MSEPPQNLLILASAVPVSGCNRVRLDSSGQVSAAIPAQSAHFNFTRRAHHVLCTESNGICGRQ